jgi:uncharacterized coiled-coil protein SlyX
MPAFHFLTPGEYAGLLALQKFVFARLPELESQMATMQEALAALRQEVAETKGANASASVLIKGLAAKVAELAAAAAAGQAVADELTALSNELSNSTDGLVADIAANPVPAGDGGGNGPVVA